MAEPIKITKTDSIEMPESTNTIETPASGFGRVFVAPDGLHFIGDDGKLYRVSHQNIVVAVIDGADASTTIPKLIVGPMPHSGTIESVSSKTNDNITVGATSWIGDIHKITQANANSDGQGTTIFSTKPSISNGNMRQVYGAPDSVTTFGEGDWFAFYTDQVGTNVTLITISMTIRYG